MDGAQVLDIARDGIWVMILVASPIMVVGLAVGIVIALFQALTQIQEMTLTFIPKVVLMVAAALILLPFMMQTLGTFTQGIAERIIEVGRTDDTATP